MKVRIRKDGDDLSAYFLDWRRLIGVNEVGAEILELTLNQEKEEREVAWTLAQRYVISIEQVKEDVEEFLNQIQAELQADNFEIPDQRQHDVPLGVELEITPSCNLRCKHCFQQRYDKKFMSLDKVKWIVDTLTKNNVCEASIIGGEPFEHPDILDILRYCGEKELVTSGGVAGSGLSIWTIFAVNN